MDALLKHLIVPQVDAAQGPCVPSTDAPTQPVAEVTQSNTQEAPSVHPAVLQFLLDNPPPVTGASVTAQSSAHVATQGTRRALQSTEQPKKTGMKDKNNAAPSIPVTQTIPIGPKQCSNESQSICSFWYHFGSCRNDPESADYSGALKTCKLTHHLGPGTENLNVQMVPWQWHRKPCGLERCRQRHGKEDKSTRMQRTATKASHAEDQAVYAAPAAGVASQRPAQAKQAMAFKAQAQGDQTVSSTKRRKRKGEKRKRGDVPSGQMAALSKPPAVAARPKLAVRSVNKSAKAVAETCFFWYHGLCKRGNRCPMLHALTTPPSYVRPPPDYMHYVPCGLDWCPGDQRFEHEQHGHHDQQRGQVKKACVGRGIKEETKGSGKEDVEQFGVIRFKFDDGGNSSNQDWFLAGFPHT